MELSQVLILSMLLRHIIYMLSQSAYGKQLRQTGSGRGQVLVECLFNALSLVMFWMYSGRVRYCSLPQGQWYFTVCCYNILKYSLFNAFQLLVLTGYWRGSTKDTEEINGWTRWSREWYGYYRVSYTCIIYLSTEVSVCIFVCLFTLLLS